MTTSTTMADAALERLAIRERIEAYSDAVFRHDADAWIACWADDAVWSLPGAEVRGRAVIRGAWEQAMAGFKLAAFFAQPGVVEVNGHAATARVYTQEILELADGGMRRIIGAYDDELVKEGGAWGFKSRRYRVLRDEGS